LKVNILARKLSDFIEKITAIPLMTIGGAMVMVVLVGTISRYIFNNPLLWTEEAARYLMIWMALVGASITLKRREHVGIEFVVNKFNPKVQLIIKFISDILILYFLYILTKRGFIMALEARPQVSPALKISMFWPLLSVPVMGFLTSIQLILRMIIDAIEIGGK
jgi:TRAP-type C4-dicarboxylate transport system permease small subunit